jgi:hypothetical protein
MVKIKYEFVIILIKCEREIGKVMLHTYKPSEPHDKTKIQRNGKTELH